MKKLLFAITVTFLITSCSKLKIFNFNSNDSSAIENDKEEPKSPFDVDDSEYKVFGKIRPHYELGFDDNNHAFLTDTRSNQQIVFICIENNPYYSKEEYLHIYDITIRDDLDLKEKLADRINDLKQYSQKEETVWSEHFNANITRYFVSYMEVHGMFHI